MHICVSKCLEGFGWLWIGMGVDLEGFGLCGGMWILMDVVGCGTGVIWSGVDLEGYVC